MAAEVMEKAAKAFDVAAKRFTEAQEKEQEAQLHVKMMAAKVPCTGQVKPHATPAGGLSREGIVGPGCGLDGAVTGTGARGCGGAGCST